MLLHSLIALYLIVQPAYGQIEEQQAMPQLGPGASEMDSATTRRVLDAYTEITDTSVARTRHWRKPGTPQFINRLITSSSPYLRQHAHNPVNWHPWGAEAFAEARRRAVPVFLSIGYAT